MSMLQRVWKYPQPIHPLISIRDGSNFASANPGALQQSAEGPSRVLEQRCFTSAAQQICLLPCRCRMQLPEGLPPSFRGTAVRYSYSLEAHSRFTVSPVVMHQQQPSSTPAAEAPQVGIGI